MYIGMFAFLFLWLLLCLLILSDVESMHFVTFFYYMWTGA